MRSWKSISKKHTALPSNIGSLQIISIFRQFSLFSDNIHYFQTIFIIAQIFINIARPLKLGCIYKYIHEEASWSYYCLTQDTPHYYCSVIPLTHYCSGRSREISNTLNLTRQVTPTKQLSMLLTKGLRQ